jgi:hypothetical protein
MELNLGINMTKQEILDKTDQAIMLIFEIEKELKLGSTMRDAGFKARAGINSFYNEIRNIPEEKFPFKG